MERSVTRPLLSNCCSSVVIPCPGVPQQLCDKVLAQSRQWFNLPVSIRAQTRAITGSAACHQCGNSNQCLTHAHGNLLKALCVLSLLETLLQIRKGSRYPCHYVACNSLYFVKQSILHSRLVVLTNLSRNRYCSSPPFTPSGRSVKGNTPTLLYIMLETQEIRIFPPCQRWRPMACLLWHVMYCKNDL